MRFPGFIGEWEKRYLANYLRVHPERNVESEFNREDVLSVSGDYGVVNQIELLGRSFAGKDVSNYHVVRKGNIIYTKSPLKEFPYGIVKMNKGSDGIVSTLYAVYDVKDTAYGEFIEQYFASADRANRYFKPIVRIGAKHDMKIGNDEVLHNKVAFPSLSEQRRIADFLRHIDERISIQNKIIEDLKQLKTGIENKCFGSLSGRRCSLEDILIERIVKTTRNNQHDILSSTVNGIFNQKEYFNKEVASANNTGYKVIYKDDIVLSPQNLWMGNINYNNRFDIGIVSPSYKVFSINEGFDKQFIASLLKSSRAIWMYSFVSEQGASIVRRNLNFDSFMQLSFPIPELREQKRIGKAIFAVAEKISLEEDARKSLEKQKKTLLSQMFI